MWQICGHIPQTLMILPDITSIAAQLSVSFFIETFIHAKEKVILNLFPFLNEVCMHVYFIILANNGAMG